MEPIMEDKLDRNQKQSQKEKLALHRCYQKYVVRAEKKRFPSLYGIDLEQNKKNYAILSLDLARLLDRNEILPSLWRFYFLTGNIKLGWRFEEPTQIIANKEKRKHTR